MDKNPPASAGATGSIPGPGRFHMPGNTLELEIDVLEIEKLEYFHYFILIIA